MNTNIPKPWRDGFYDAFQGNTLNNIYPFAGAQWENYKDGARAGERLRISMKLTTKTEPDRDENPIL